MLRPIVVAFALLVSAPLAFAQESGTLDASMTFKDGFKTLDMRADMTVSGADAAEMRMGMDGNGDGQTTQAEVDAFVEQFGAMFKGMMEQEMAGDDMQLDGKSPTDVEVGDLEFEGVVGPADSQEPVTMRMELAATFAPGSGDKHTLVMKDDGSGDSEEGPEGVIRIKGPTGYVIESYTEMPGVTLSSDKTTLSATSESAGKSGKDMTIVFAPKGADSKGSPGAGALVAVAVLAMAAFARRRAA